MRRTVRWNGLKPFKTESGTILFDEIDDIAVEACRTVTAQSPIAFR